MREYLVVGLGNIGSSYENTRHNIGFKIIDELACEYNIKLDKDTLGLINHFIILEKKVHLLKPTTYMNKSGKAVNYWFKYLKTSITNLLVLSDDVFLPFGMLRLRKKGSAGGHNGLKSIEEHLQTKEYARLKFGIDQNFPKGEKSEYVLNDFTQEEKKNLKGHIKESVTLVKQFLDIA